MGHHVQDATEHVLDERKPNAEPLQLALERGILPGDVQQLQQF